MCSRASPHKNRNTTNINAVQGQQQKLSTLAHNPAIYTNNDIDDINIATPLQEIIADQPTTHNNDEVNINNEENNNANNSDANNNNNLDVKQCPVDTCRTGHTLYMDFPIGTYIKCTEQPCLSDFAIQKSWFSMKKIDEKRITVIKWCKKCNLRIRGQMPNHPCFKEMPMMPPMDAAKFSFISRRYPRSFSNHIDRRNHEKQTCFKNCLTGDAVQYTNNTTRRQRRES